MHGGGAGRADVPSLAPRAKATGEAAVRTLFILRYVPLAEPACASAASAGPTSFTEAESRASVCFAARLNSLS